MNTKATSKSSDRTGNVNEDIMILNARETPPQLRHLETPKHKVRINRLQ